MEIYFINPNPANNPLHINEINQTKGRFFHNHPQLLGSFSNCYDELENAKDQEHLEDERVNANSELVSKEY